MNSGHLGRHSGRHLEWVIPLELGSNEMNPLLSESLTKPSTHFRIPPTRNEDIDSAGGGAASLSESAAVKSGGAIPPSQMGRRKWAESEQADRGSGAGATSAEASDGGLCGDCNLLTGRGLWNIDGGPRDSENPVARGAQEKSKK